jgi:DnaJ-class molecular chaperone
MANCDILMSDAPVDQIPEFACKHCDATGNGCEACQGLGFDPNEDFGDDPLKPFKDCPACHGEGVIQATSPAGRGGVS